MDFIPQLDYWLIRVKGTQDYYYPWGKTLKERISPYPHPIGDEKSARAQFHAVTAERKVHEKWPEMELLCVRCEIVERRSDNPDTPIKYLLAEKSQDAIVKITGGKKRSKDAIDSIRHAILNNYDGQKYAFYMSDWAVVQCIRELDINSSLYGGLVRDDSELVKLRLALEDKNFPKIVIDLDELKSTL